MTDYKQAIIDLINPLWGESIKKDESYHFKQSFLDVAAEILALDKIARKFSTFESLPPELVFKERKIKEI